MIEFHVQDVDIPSLNPDAKLWDDLVQDDTACMHASKQRPLLPLILLSRFPLESTVRSKVRRQLAYPRSWRLSLI